MKQRQVAIALALLLASSALVIAVLAAALWLYLPTYVRERVIAEAKALGVALEPGEISFGLERIELSGASARLIGAPSIAMKLGTVEIEIADWAPAEVALRNVDVEVHGSLPRVLFELGEWTKSYPSTYGLPVVASDVSLCVTDVGTGSSGGTEQGARQPWFELTGGALERTDAGAAFSAEEAKVRSLSLGRVSAGMTHAGSFVSIGFGAPLDPTAAAPLDPTAAAPTGLTAAAPLRLEAAKDARGGRVKIVLAPTEIGRFQAGLGFALPLPKVRASGDVELRFPPDPLKGEVTGRLGAKLDGFVPPHPPELDGFLFGDTTTLETELSIDESRERVALRNTKVKAGNFVLEGGGRIERKGEIAVAELELEGALPCSALAGVAAESRLGRLLGRASGKQARRTAEAFVGGSVSVTVNVKAKSDDLAHAEVTRTIGVGCGLRPLTLGELLELAPSAKDLGAIGKELGKKLEDMGRDFGLPSIPPRVPRLPDADDESER